MKIKARRNKILTYRFLPLITILLFLAIFSIIPKSAVGESKSDEIPVVVKKGDTLWDLAIKYGDKDKDPRKTIYLIKQRNQLKTAGIEIGQLLIIPQ